jgi:hypothetical protein
MKHILFLLALALALGFASCGSKEDPYTREQKEIDEFLSSEGLDVYQAFKVSVRGTKTVGQDTAFDNARMRLFGITGYVLQQATDTTHSVDVLEMATTLAEAKPAIDELLKKDEDSLPTVMENISFVVNPPPAQDPMANLFSESEEHLILGGLWFAGSRAYPDLALYELSRVKTSDIREANFRCLAEMFRSVLYLSNKWPYHAEKSADDFLAITESEKEALMANPWPAVDAQGNPVTPEQAWHQLRAIGFVLRACAHHTCEDEEKKEAAFGDLSEFVQEAEAGGLDHKVVDIAGLVVALKNEDNDAALVYVEKLEQRTDLTQEEKELIGQIKTDITDKKNEEAQDAIEENGLLPGCAAHLVATQFMNMPVVKDLHASEAGKKFISITHIKADELVPGTGAIDSLEKDAEGLIDKVL